MATETILIDYKARVDGLIAELKTVQKEMKVTEESGKKAAKGTEDAFIKTEKAAISLRTQIRTLKEQLANASDPKDVERLAKALGKLTDQMQDAGDAARVFSSESKFEQMGSAIGSIGGKLRNLDFKGAADQSKLLVAVSKSLTFKEALTGAKDFGSTLLNIGKSLLMNPIFLIGAAVTLIITNFDKLKNAGGIVGDMFRSLGNVISFITDGITSLANAIGLIDSSVNQFAEDNKKMFEETGKFISDINKGIAKNTIEIIKNQGKINDAAAQSLNLQEGFADELNRIDEKRLASIQAVKDALQIKPSDVSSKAYFDQIAQIKVINDNARSEEVAAGNLFNSEIEKLNSASLKTKQDQDTAALKLRIEDQKRANKIINDNLKKAADDALKLHLEAYNNWADAENASIDKQEAKKRDDEKDRIQESGKQWLAELDKKADAENAAYDESIDAAKKYEAEKKAIQSAGFQFISDAVNAINQIQQNNIQSEINGVNETKDAEISALDDQLKNKTITQEQYQKKKDAIDEKAREKERQLKIKAFEADKTAAIIQTLINTAQAVVSGFAQGGPVLAALAAATGAIQLAVISSQPTPKFAKGGLVGGKLHSEGGTLIEAQRGEYVSTIEATSQHKGLLEAMNKGKESKYIQDFYIAPILRAQIKKQSEQKDNSFASNIANSLALNSNFKDSNLLDSMKQSRRAEKENFMYLVKALKGQKRNPRSW